MNLFDILLGIGEPLGYVNLYLSSALGGFQPLFLQMFFFFFLPPSLLRILWCMCWNAWCSPTLCLFFFILLPPPPPPASQTIISIPLSSNSLILFFVYIGNTFLFLCILCMFFLLLRTVHLSILQHWKCESPIPYRCWFLLSEGCKHLLVTFSKNYCKVYISCM